MKWSLRDIIVEVEISGKIHTFNIDPKDLYPPGDNGEWGGEIRHLHDVVGERLVSFEGEMEP